MCVQEDEFMSCLYKRVCFMCAQDDDEFIGFATLPDQVHRKAVRRGFDFTLMVVGKSRGFCLCFSVYGSA